MDWSADEVDEVEKEQTRGHMSLTPARDILRRMMTRAVELAAARGGTMTAPVLEMILADMAGEFGNGVERIRAHISALGARNAVLERDKALWKEQAITWKRLYKSSQGWAAQAEENNALKERIAALERESAEQYAEAVSINKLHDSALSEVERLKARCATLSAAGQVLSAHVDSANACAGEPDCGWHNGGPCSACKAADVAKCDHSHGGIHIRSDGVEVCVECGESIRHPCSPTCTHDDAATPGHPERVKERSEAVSAATQATLDVEHDSEHPEWPAREETVKVVLREECEHGIPQRDDCATCYYYQGAEAMRAACWEAVSRACDLEGVSIHMREHFKSAIEGATP